MSSRNGERQYWPLSSLYQYEVLPVDSEKSKSLTIVSADVIHRKKTIYSRAKNRLYIKQFTEQVDGFWKLKVCIISLFYNAIFNVRQKKFLQKPIFYSDYYCLHHLAPVGAVL